MISYGLVSFFCLWRGWFGSDGREANSAQYVNVLKKRIFPFKNLYTNNAIFEQDNAAANTFKLTKTDLKQQKMYSIGLAQ